MFKQAYIPRTLNEVKNYERDVDIMMRLKEEDMALNTQQDNVSGLVPVSVSSLCVDMLPYLLAIKGMLLGCKRGVLYL